ERSQLLFAHLFIIRRLLELLDKFQPPDTFADCREIGQGAAEPALINIELSASHRRFLYRFLRLLFATNEQNLAAAACDLLEKFRCAMQLLDSLVQVDDVNLVSLLENVRLHLRVPALGLVTEMHARFKKLRHQFNCVCHTKNRAAEEGERRTGKMLYTGHYRNCYFGRRPRGLCP